MKRHWVCLQLKFEAPQDFKNAIAPGGIKWQYIAIISTFSNYYYYYYYYYCDRHYHHHYYSGMRRGNALGRVCLSVSVQFPI